MVLPYGCGGQFRGSHTRRGAKRECLFGNVASRCDVGLLAHRHHMSVSVGVIATSEKKGNARDAIGFHRHWARSKSGQSARGDSENAQHNNRAERRLCARLWETTDLARLSSAAWARQSTRAVRAGDLHSASTSSFIVTECSVLDQPWLALATGLLVLCSAELATTDAVGRRAAAGSRIEGDRASGAFCSCDDDRDLWPE